MTTLDTLRSELADNRAQLDSLHNEPIGLASILATDLANHRRHALLRRIEKEMGR